MICLIYLILYDCFAFFAIFFLIQFTKITFFSKQNENFQRRKIRKTTEIFIGSDEAKLFLIIYEMLKNEVFLSVHFIFANSTSNDLLNKLNNKMKIKF